MEFKKEILLNGLNIIGEVNKQAKSTAIGFFVKTGARDETAQVSGVSHFLEHMLFKGTENLTAAQVNNAFDRTGANFNAGTGWENTSYYASVLPEYLPEITNLWSQLMRPALRDEDFNIEKNVIKQEIAMYKDMPGFDVMDQCQTLYFGDHPCGNSILGTEESIDKLSLEQMRDYFSQRYAPNNMTLVVVGNFDWEEISNLAKTKCSSWQLKPVERVTTDTKGTGKIQRVTKSNLLHEHICIMSHAVPANSPLRFAAALLATIIGDSFGSRYYWNLIDTAIADNASMQFGPMDGTGVFYSNFSCNPDQTSKLLDKVSEIFQNLLEKGVTEEELQAAKNKTLSELVIQNELPKGRLVSVGSNWIYLKQYRNIQDDIADINSVTTDDIAAFIKDYDLSKYTQFSLGPGK